jgi:uroporphyrinogen-III synthase
MVSAHPDRSIEAPLQGKLFISTRAENRSGELKEYFTRAGAELLELPVIAIKPLSVPPSGRIKLERTETFEWIIFTSENGVMHFMEEYKKVTGSISLPAQTGIAAIGPNTARVAVKYGLNPRFISRTSNAAGFSDELISLFRGKHPRILWPTGSLSPGILTDRLNRFCDIERLDLYQTVMPEKIKQSVLQLVIDNLYDMIFFFSPSAVRNFCSIIRARQIGRMQLKVACIGPVTRDTCNELNIVPSFTSLIPETAALFESTLDYFKSKEK